MADLTPDQHSDLVWLGGYRKRAAGKPRPVNPPNAADGWDDLDAVLKLIEQALNPRPKPPTTQPGEYRQVGRLPGEG